jgi:hypothetical protein
MKSIQFKSNNIFPIYRYGGADKLKGNLGDLIHNAIVRNSYYQTLEDLTFPQIIEEI